MVLLLPTVGAGYCALMLDSCQGKMAEVGVGATDCCLSCFDAAMTESIIKTPLKIYTPHHDGVQAWLPTNVNLAVTFQVSTFRSEMAVDTGPPPNPVLLSVLRI
jgi:hypothetical protein